MSKNTHGAPLTPAVFHILLALYGGEKHGYEIMKLVEKDSSGSVTMGPGTLYGSLERMMKSGLVAESNTSDPRRIYYKLTAEGRTVFKAETERLAQASRLAQARLRTA